MKHSLEHYFKNAAIEIKLLVPYVDATDTVSQMNEFGYDLKDAYQSVENGMRVLIFDRKEPEDYIYIMIVDTKSGKRICHNIELLDKYLLLLNRIPFTTNEEIVRLVQFYSDKLSILVYDEATDELI